MILSFNFNGKVKFSKKMYGYLLNSSFFFFKRMDKTYHTIAFKEIIWKMNLIMHFFRILALSIKFDG